LNEDRVEQLKQIMEDNHYKIEVKEEEEKMRS
jgi:hypothetical protein